MLATILSSIAIAIVIVAIVAAIYVAQRRWKVGKFTPPLQRSEDADHLVTYGPRTDTSSGISLASCAGGRPKLSEYSSSGLPTDVGVSVGPVVLGAPEHSEGDLSDEALPWVIPSSPAYVGSVSEDYYGPEGPTLHRTDVYALAVPDHDFLTS